MRVAFAGFERRNLTRASGAQYIFNPVTLMHVKYLFYGAIMNRITDLTLRVSLLLASLGSLISLTKMLLEHFIPTHYYWWAAVAFFGATIVLSAAIRLRDDRSAGSSRPNDNEAGGQD